MFCINNFPWVVYPICKDVTFHMAGKTCLSRSEPRCLTKTSAEAGDSSWLKVDLYAPAAYGTAKICACPWKQTGIKGN